MAAKPTPKSENDRLILEKYTHEAKDAAAFDITPDLKEGPKTAIYIGKLVAKNNAGQVSISIKEKCKAVTISGCENITVIIEKAVVGPIEIVNCKKLTVQTNDHAPIVQIDGSDRCSVYLHDATTRVYSSKSSSNNVYIPVKDDDPVEIPLPEQFITTFSGKKAEHNVSKGYKD